MPQPIPIAVITEVSAASRAGPSSTAPGSPAQDQSRSMPNHATAVNTWIVSAVAWFGMDLDWSCAGLPGAVLEGPARLAALTSVMTAIGIGWGITWFTYAADYSRFVSRSVPRTKLYIASAAGHFIPVVWLGLLGASLATTNGSVDPGQLLSLIHISEPTRLRRI